MKYGIVERLLRLKTLQHVLIIFAQVKWTNDYMEFQNWQKQFYTHNKEHQQFWYI